jgi:hypothetical protein
MPVKLPVPSTILLLADVGGEEAAGLALSFNTGGRGIAGPRGTAGRRGISKASRETAGGRGTDPDTLPLSSQQPLSRTKRAAIKTTMHLIVNE